MVEMPRLELYGRSSMIKLQNLFAGILFGLISLQPIVSAQGQTSVPSATPQSRRQLQLEPCRNPTFDDAARCGKYEVFENRETKAGRKIQLNIMVLPALNERHASDPLFFLAGGPGQGAVTAASIVGKSFLNDMRRDRDIV